MPTVNETLVDLRNHPERERLAGLAISINARTVRNLPDHYWFTPARHEKWRLLSDAGFSSPVLHVYVLPGGGSSFNLPQAVDVARHLIKAVAATE